MFVGFQLSMVDGDGYTFKKYLSLDNPASQTTGV
jgi:hypothetical protein